jgi:hypothetical protein
LAETACPATSAITISAFLNARVGAAAITTRNTNSGVRSRAQNPNISR